MIDPPEHIPDLRRVKWFYTGIAAMLVVIIFRLWFLQIVKGQEMMALCDTQAKRKIRKVAARGSILDVRGRVLATSRPKFVVSVLPDEFLKHPGALPRLAHLLQQTEQELSDTIREYRSRSAPFDPVPVKRDVDIGLLTPIEEQQLDLPGVLVTRDPLRYYQDNALCTHVLGVTRPISAEKLETLRDRDYHGGDYIGVEGIEAAYEHELRGRDGGQVIAVDARGRMRQSLAEVQPVPGRTLRLTIDRDLQKVTCDALREQLGKGHPGAAVALDPNTGAVRAFVSLPSYDLNRYGLEYGKLLSDPMHPFLNRVSGSRYPVGSTFKLVTAAAGLEAGAISPTSRDYCSGSIRSGNRVFHCDKLSGHGSLNFEKALGASCDVYFWHVAQRVGPEGLANMARRFGLGDKTGIDIPSSVDNPGRIPTPDWKKKARRGPWVPGDLLNMSIGQGDIGVTPLQLAVYTGALCNGGDLLRPQLVQEVIDTSAGRHVTVRRLNRTVRRRLGLRPENRKAIIRGMERALHSGGTAAGVRVPGISIAGKTGTAEAFFHGHKKSHSVFVCFAPVEQPKIAIAVMIEHGGFGAEAAAPVARRMLAGFFHRPLALQTGRAGHSRIRD